MELLVTLAVALILAGLALPAYRTMVLQAQEAAMVSRLVSAIQFTRQAAVFQQHSATLCASQDARHCGGFWEQGWIVLMGEKLLRTYDPLPVGGSLEWQGPFDHLQYEPTGTARGQAGTFYFYPDRGNKKEVKKIIVSPTGRVRVER